ncbi:hypothetical protein [uncultured Aquimarina sp.]|uniref:hypothetical protein n=1 Tax=uncultured Aquimarina sp. TaxID=575652 RepID=UPI0026170277|nr:hypothetical protein [uncultured Aquimarina sp.]
MGYELNIKREDNQTKLTKEEWANYIKSDFEFEQINEYSVQHEDGKYLTVSTPNAGLWKTTKGEVPFTFFEEYGWISVKNPDEWIIKKMISIANELDAIVLGDEGEKYDEKNILGEQSKEISKINNRKWWQFWKTDKSENSYPKAKPLESDIENDLFIGDCFHPKNHGFDIGLVLLEIFQGQNGKYYSFAPIILDKSKSYMEKFYNGNIKFQPFPISKSLGIPTIGIMNKKDLLDLRVLYSKEGKIEFEQPIPKSTGSSYLVNHSEESIRKFVDELEMYYSEDERKIIPVSKLIK